MVIILGVGTTLADEEPNDYLSSAEGISSGTHTGVVTVDSDESDCYTFNAGSGQRIVIEFDPTFEPDELDVSIWRDAGFAMRDLLFCFYDARGPYGCTREYYIPDGEATNGYYIEIESKGTNHRYTFILDVTNQDEGGQGHDAPYDAYSESYYDDALLIDPGTFDGHVGDDDYGDCYRFRAKPNLDIELEFTSFAQKSTQKLHLKTRDYYKAHLTLEAGPQQTVDGSFWIPNVTGWDMGYLLVKVDDPSSPTQAKGAYRFTLKVVKSSHQNDALSTGDVAETSEDAYELSEGTYSGTLEYEDFGDCYKVIVSGGMALKVGIEKKGTTSMDVGAEVFSDSLLTDKVGEVGAQSWSRSKTWTVPENVPTGTPWFIMLHYYYVLDEDLYKSIRYSLEVMLDQGPPSADFTVPKKAEAGKKLVFKASVSDDKGIDSVILYYRFDDEEDWSSSEMFPQNGVHTTKLTDGKTEGRKRIEYYIVVEDYNELTTTYGNSTEPKAMKVDAASDSPGYLSIEVIITMAVIGMFVGLRRRR